ncbi:uncharacterized protein GGS22DRAFT_189448 [Annulohypoxylon maeteangense]|uniref:uncharacterized protein n=1 Tax=Annulohypoxylon maeteangense TaxID=1927788 RepID=UPI0020072FFA|nr:uncharacterized protein GGS22DRAFT_189448 [Annulohypoxylon maeteangense]KAI0884319.1 hypothetical protein GGS22DRAFT_189448 [Annulohypoxylon maeteangense]
MALKQERMLSFGVELEFYIFWSIKGEEITSRPQGFESHPGAPLIVDKYDTIHDIFEPLLASVRELLQGSPEATVGATEKRLGNAFSYTATNERSGWVGVELVSPALWTTNEGFNEVRRVCEFLQSTFWISTPEHCGLHIHVGQGNDWLPIIFLRQIAAFLYAADPILAHSYPEHRLSGSRRKEDGLLKSIFGLFRKRVAEARIEDKFPRRPTTISYMFNSDTLQSAITYIKNFHNVKQSLEDFTPAPMMEAVSEILKSTHRHHIVELTRCPNRPTYSFLRLAMYSKKTIEFRQAAGTIDPAEVVSRARIAVRLCEFAANATQEDLYTMFYDFALVEADPAWIDFYDLFVDLGLRPEARVIHAVLTGTMDQSVRDRYFAQRESY